MIVITLVVERINIIDAMKEFYREYFLCVCVFVKMSYFCQQVGINTSNLSKFMNGNDGAVSLDKLEAMYKLVQEKIA